MQFKLIKVTLLVTCLTLTGCQLLFTRGSGNLDTVTLDDHDCTYPKSERIAPEWICGKPLGPTELQAIGSASRNISLLDNDGSAQPFGSGTREAREAAEDKLAEQLLKTLAQMELSSEGEEAASQLAEELMSPLYRAQLNEAVSTYSKVLSSRADRDAGTQYVLVGLDLEGAQRALQSSLIARGITPSEAEIISQKLIENSLNNSLR